MKTNKNSSAKGVAPDTKKDTVRVICHNEGKAISDWISRNEARTIKREHEEQFPTHVTDYEEWE